ncbi:MAG: hypothetical protein Q8P93_01360 [bacterium]|nr:hypothetical protein [bacterium]
MKTRRGFVNTAFLVALLLGILIVGGGMYITNRQQSPVQHVSEAQIDNSQKPSPVDEKGSQETNTEATEWKTYTNNEFEFQVAYPADWWAGESLPGNCNPQCAVFYFGPKNVHRQAVGASSFTITVYPKNTITKIQGAKFESGDKLYVVSNDKLETDLFYSFLQGFKITALTVPGMSKFTDKSFGSSFWYPSTWEVQEETPKDISSYTGGAIIKTVRVKSSGGDILVSEFISSGEGIIDNSNCGPVEGCPDAVRYYFDESTNTWMRENIRESSDSNDPSSEAYQVDLLYTSSMGGLPILRGNARHANNSIVPITANNFLIVENVQVGNYRIEYLAETILALDPTIATARSLKNQELIVRKEGVLYGELGSEIDGPWYTDGTYLYHAGGNIIVGAGSPSFVWYKGESIPGADPSTFTVAGRIPIEDGHIFAYDANHTYGENQEERFTIDGVVVR